MSQQTNNLPARSFTNDEITLIRQSVAPTATPKEFELFLYRCKHMGLDPLKPGQIHFVKYGTGPGTIIVGREGFRSRAAHTGKHSGTKLGVIRDDGGVVIGAWAEVYRSDWKEPAREEAYLEEYNTGKAQWAKMPITMIKKVAECAALRMAFPDELGGVYEKSEMDQAEAELDEPESQYTDPNDPLSHVIGGGPLKTQRLGDVLDRDGLPKLQDYISRLEIESMRNKKPFPVWAQKLKNALEESLQREEEQISSAEEAMEADLNRVLGRAE